MNRPLPALPHLGFGHVHHRRLRPRTHAFTYRTFFLLLPMRALAQQTALACNRPAAISFYDRDHGDGRSPQQGGALAWLLELLHREGIDDADGDIWLHCYPRVWGYTFKPVSFWYCHRADGSLRAIVVEVNNTFGERHCYLLEDPPTGATLTARKVFHVSPFCEVRGNYAFRFQTHSTRDGLPRSQVHIDLNDEHGLLLHTSVSGRLEPVTPQTLRRALWRYPVMTLAVIARIHWQALRLWLLRVGFHTKPPAPTKSVTR